MNGINYPPPSEPWARSATDICVALLRVIHADRELTETERRAYASRCVNQLRETIDGIDQGWCGDDHDATG